MSFPSSKVGRKMQRIFIFSYWLVKLLPSVCAPSLNGLNLLISPQELTGKTWKLFCGAEEALSAGCALFHPPRLWLKVWHSAPMCTTVHLGPATGKELWEKALGETSWGSFPVFRCHAPLAWTPWDVALRGPLSWLSHCPSAPGSPSLAEQPHSFNSLTTSKGNSDLPLHYIKRS